ncbi:5609_t:CDS:1, partial [Entrophospora sp. SA101]
QRLMSSKTHKAKENLYENKQQRTLDASLSSSESKENEWAIHCGSTLNIEVALGEHWSNMAEHLPLLLYFK